MPVWAFSQYLPICLHSTLCHASNIHFLFNIVTALSSSLPIPTYFPIGPTKNFRPIQTERICSPPCSSASIQLSQPRGCPCCDLEADEAAYTGWCWWWLSKPWPVKLGFLEKAGVIYTYVSVGSLFPLTIISNKCSLTLWRPSKVLSIWEERDLQVCELGGLASGVIQSFI